MPRITIDIDQHHKDWNRHQDIDEDFFQIQAKALFSCLENNAISHVDISVVLTDDSTIQDLNREYRSKDRPTNVLSFPLQDFSTGSVDKTLDMVSLGDVVLSYQTIEKEAIEQQKSFKDHVCHLFVHGVLHLLGYDHEKDDEAQKMEALEVEILNKLGIKSPYDTN